MRSDSALLIVGHGSTVNPDSSAPTLAHAAEIRCRNIFADVQSAFWKEEPSLRDAIFLFDPDTIKNVYVVPNLNGRITKRANGQTWNYGEPVGNHPLMTELLVQRAREIAPDVPENQTSLLIVAHGTDLNENSAVAAKREAERIRRLGRYANVLNVYMEEFPLVSDWRVLTNTPNVVVVPFFISDGLHSYEDIPVMLGIIDEKVASLEPPADKSKRSLDFARDDAQRAAQSVFRRGPYKIDNRSLFYASSIGADPRVADIIVEQAAAGETNGSRN